MMDDVDHQIARRIKIQHEIGQKSVFMDNFVIGQEVLREELAGGNQYQQQYDLSTSVRDMLLAHSRQDVAHALSNTSSLLTHLKILDTNVRFANFWLLVIIGLLLSHRWWW